MNELYKELNIVSFDYDNYDSNNMTNVMMFSEGGTTNTKKPMRPNNESVHNKIYTLLGKNVVGNKTNKKRKSNIGVSRRV